MHFIIMTIIMHKIMHNDNMHNKQNIMHTYDYAYYAYYYDHNAFYHYDHYYA